jgi:hypothetical protein
MSDHDSEHPEWMRELDAGLPTPEDILAARLAEERQISAIFLKYTAAGLLSSPCTDDEILAVLDDDDAAVWLAWRAARDEGFM